MGGLPTAGLAWGAAGGFRCVGWSLVVPDGSDRGGDMEFVQVGQVAASERKRTLRSH